MWLRLVLVKLARDLTRPETPKWWFSTGNATPKISGKPRFVKYYSIWPDVLLKMVVS